MALTVGLLGAGQVDGVVELFGREGESLGGSSDPRVLRSVVRDGLGPRSPVVVPVACDGELVVGTMVVMVGGGHAYWRALPRRHPLTALRLASRRARKLWRSRRPQPDPEPATRSTGVASALPEGLAEDPRLHVAPPSGREGRSGFHAVGPTVAFGSMVLVDAERRQQGIAGRMHEVAFAELARRGIERYECSFLLDYEPSVRLYLSLGFTIYRYPFGFLGCRAVPGGDGVVG